eukprot:jgi/Botrbrau1/22154/Bobra.0206s0077.1
MTEKVMMKNATSRAEREAIRRRDLLLFFRGKCTPLRWDWGAKLPNRGKLIRRDVMRELADAGPDVRIECTGDKMELKEEHAKQITHDQQVRLYFKSKFCLVISGDSQTSRRLPEAVMTGCIPVFFRAALPHHSAGKPAGLPILCSLFQSNRFPVLEQKLHCPMGSGLYTAQREWPHTVGFLGAGPEEYF